MFSLCLWRFLKFSFTSLKLATLNWSKMWISVWMCQAQGVFPFLPCIPIISSMTLPLSPERHFLNLINKPWWNEMSVSAPLLHMLVLQLFWTWKYFFSFDEHFSDLHMDATLSTKYKKSLCWCMCFFVKGKLEPFLSVAGQTLESFVKSLDEEQKPQLQNYNSHEHQFVLALAGVITSKDLYVYYHYMLCMKHIKSTDWFADLAAVTCGRDYISSSAHVLLDTLMQLLGLMKSGVFPKLKVWVNTHRTMHMDIHSKHCIKKNCLIFIHSWKT